MRSLIAGLLAIQIGVTAPAQAADLGGSSLFMDHRRGAFAGVRIQAQLGAPERELHAAFTVAPAANSRTGAHSRMTLGEGLELGISPNAKPELRIAGERLDQMALFGRRPAGDRANLSTLATVAVVAGVIVVAGAIAFVHVANEASCFHGGSDDDC
jgi:hypothetical protein